MMEDIAVLTGGRCITEDLGIKLENVTLDDLGRAKRVTIDKDNTTIVEGEGKKADIAGSVVAQIKPCRSKTPTSRLRPREAPGAPRQACRRRGRRQRRRCHRDGDEGEEGTASKTRLHATRAAVEEGIVPGGGTWH